MFFPLIHTTEHVFLFFFFLPLGCLQDVFDVAVKLT